MSHGFAIDLEAGVNRCHLQSQRKACKLPCWAGLPQICRDGTEVARYRLVRRVVKDEGPRCAFHLARELLCATTIAERTQTVSARVPCLGIQHHLLRCDVFRIWWEATTLRYARVGCGGSGCGGVSCSSFLSFSFSWILFFSFLFLLFKCFSCFFFSFFLYFFHMFYCWHYYQSLTVSSVVGAPWRCGVLTTWSGVAGIGLGRLLGREHASTPQSGVEAPRMLKLPRLYCCCCFGRS